MSMEARQTYWQVKLEKLKVSLEENNFAAWIAKDTDQARDIFWDVFEKINPRSVSFGGSLTVKETKIYQQLKARSDLEVIDTFDMSVSKKEVIERRRRSLLVDLFITGTNAITRDGHLINLDGLGNRVAGLTFGPWQVILFIGRNKIVNDREEAVSRIKDYAAPINAIRLARNTPCTQTMQCEDCNSPDRICNTWTVTEKSNPPERVKIILINQDLGF